MKKFSVLFLAVVGMFGLIACASEDECEDGATKDACGNCPAGDDDAT